MGGVQMAWKDENGFEAALHSLGEQFMASKDSSSMGGGGRGGGGGGAIF